MSAQEGDKEENPYDMHNFEYQKSQVEHGKRLTEIIDCADICIMKVLKNLIHVFMIIGCVGCIYMLFIIATDDVSGSLDPYEKNLARETSAVAGLMSYHPVAIGLNKTAQTAQQLGILDAMSKFYNKYWDSGNFFMVHPLYVKLQKESQLNVLLKEPFNISDHEYDEQTKPIDGKSFYRKYMSKSLPCVFRKEAVNDKLFRNLQTATDLDQFDDIVGEVFRGSQLSGLKLSHGIDFPIMTTKITRQKGWSGKYVSQTSEQKAMTYKKYTKNRRHYIPGLSGRNQEALFIDRHVINDVNYMNLITDKSAMATNGGGWLYDPVVNPVKHVMHHILASRGRYWTQWEDFPHRSPERLEYEQHICIYSGVEKIKVASPIYRQQLYVNILDNGQINKTPVDFFDIDKQKYPLTTQINFVEATLEAGDCMYVPAYYYMQTKTISGSDWNRETVMIREMYESHSKFVDVMMEALEAERLTDTERHKYERAFDGALAYLSGARN